ncbi:Ubiquitin conjugating enzyme protein [Thalictrum thalictroides]|uniref:E2 ubiquitin-conjugating enzyme n=1 Tax=Thalictrum thalictroides TaxID=46969 RepID=A0A7J6X655_THATH|nr:Ubiquitin conjugating enzyme protein [Thalictrum thalictroides]
METVSSDSGSNKKLKYSEDTLSSDQVITTASDPDLVNDDPMDLPNDSEPESESSDNLDDASSYYDEDFSYYDETLSLQAQFDAADLPPGVEASVPWLELPDKTKNLGNVSHHLNSTSSSSVGSGEEDHVLEKYAQFKSFDTVQDFSDHHYVKVASGSNKPGKGWAKTIQNEWKILEQNLPETIFVRVYEERMDLLRAAIIGASGTPYHDGLFFFDAFFPPQYPNVPPHVFYHSGGLRLNPNLYNCGKVCLSLLGTWSGGKDENWISGKSTMLQVLLSIQALVLNAKPYFNEPGYERSAGQAHGEKQAKSYNENTFVLSCKTMQYTLRSPPKHFEDLVAGHFRVRAHAILEACKEYVKGHEVGSLPEGETEEEEEKQEITNDMISGRKNFALNLRTIVGSLIPAFISNGAKDCEKYLPLADINRTAPLKM